MIQANTVITGDIATLTETGEIVEGVTVYETPGIFTVDV